MSCDGNRKKYLARLASNPVVAAACGGGSPDQVVAKLEEIYDVGVGGGTVNTGIADALTRAMFKEMQGMGITPPTHSADGLPNVRARQGYAALMRQVSTWRRVAAEATTRDEPEEAEGEPALGMAWRRSTVRGGSGTSGKVGIFVGGTEMSVQGAAWEAMKESVKAYAAEHGVSAKVAYDSTMKRWNLPGTVDDVQKWLDARVPGAKVLRPGEKLVTEASPAVAAGVAAGILTPTPAPAPAPAPAAAPRSSRSPASPVTPSTPPPVVPPAPDIPPDATAGPDPLAPAGSPMSTPGELPPELMAMVRELITGYYADDVMAFANSEPSITAERIYPVVRSMGDKIKRHYYGRTTDVPLALWARELNSSPAKVHAFVTAAMVAGGHPRCLKCGYWVSTRYPHTCPSSEFNADGYNARNRDKYGYSRWRTDQFGRPVSRKLLTDAAREFILPETDPMSNAEMEEHWGRVASAVAGHDCRVKLRPGGFATDMKGTIYADPYPLGKDADPRYNLLVTKAGIYHEIGHELTTPPGHWKTILNIAKGKEKVAGVGRGGRKLITKMYNIVEDGRMERDMATRFPGVAETLAASCKVQPRWHERVGPGVPLADEVIWPLLYTALPFFKVRPEVRAAMSPEGRALFEDLEPIARKGALGTPDDSLAAAIEITRRLEAAGVLTMPEGIEEHVTPPPPPSDDTEGAPIPPEAREDKRKKDKKKKKKSGEEGEKGGDSSTGGESGESGERGEGGSGGAGGESDEGEESSDSSGGSSGGGSSSSSGDDDDEEGDGSSSSSGSDDDERNGRGKGWRKGMKERPDDEPKSRTKKGDDDEESGGAGSPSDDDEESGGGAGGDGDGEEDEDADGDGAGGGAGDGEEDEDADGDGAGGAGGEKEPKGREDAKKPRGGGGGASGGDDEEGEGAAGGDAGEDMGDPWGDEGDDAGSDGDSDADEGDEGGEGSSDGDDSGDASSDAGDGDAGESGESGGSTSDGGSSKGGSAGEVDHEAASKATGPLKEGWEDSGGGDGEDEGSPDGGELPDSLPDVDSLITPDKLDDILDTLEGEAVRAAERVATRQGTYEALGGTLHKPMGTTRTTSRIWDQGYKREAAPHDAVEQRYRTPDGRVVTYKTGFPMTTSSATLEGLKGREVQQREISGRLARQLESVRDEAEERIRFERRGRLDRRRYVAALTGKDTVRSRMTDVPETGMAVSILLDQSGSMQDHIDGLRLYDATCIIGQALEQLEIGYEVRGHGGSSQQYKAIDDPKLDPRRAARLATDISQSNHVTAPVVGLATTSLMGADTNNRLIINLMDGDMEDDPELIPQYEATRKAGIVTFGIFLGNPNRTGMHGVTLAEKMNRYFGRNNWRAINDLSEMPKVVGRRIADIFDELQGDE